MNGQSIGAGLGAVGNQTTSRESQVQKELIELSTAIKSVDNNMSTLLLRLQPILRQEETYEAEVATPQQSVVGLASVIREERKKLEYISNVLATAFIHLEL